MAAKPGEQATEHLKDRISSAVWDALDTEHLPPDEYLVDKITEAVMGAVGDHIVEVFSETGRIPLTVPEPVQCLRQIIIGVDGKDTCHLTLGHAGHHEGDNGTRWMS